MPTMVAYRSTHTCVCKYSLVHIPIFPSSVTSKGLEVTHQSQNKLLCPRIWVSETIFQLQKQGPLEGMVRFQLWCQKEVALRRQTKSTVWPKSDTSHSGSLFEHMLPGWWHSFLGGCGIFRKWGLAGRSGSLRVCTLLKSLLSGSLGCGQFLVLIL